MSIFSEIENKLKINNLEKQFFGSHLNKGWAKITFLPINHKTQFPESFIIIRPRKQPAWQSEGSQ